MGTRRANGWGLFDLHGNVWEWCEDTYHESYEDAPSDGSAWADQGTPSRVYRGGCWYGRAVPCRIAFRYRFAPGYWNWTLGFRPSIWASAP